MQFNSETNNLDIVSDIDYWAGSDSTSYPIKDKTRNANFALDRVVSLIMKSDQKWSWDDANQGTEPIDTSTNLVAGTRRYAIAVGWLTFLRLRIKDATGNLVTLKPVDRRKLTDAELNEAAGTPRKYAKVGNWIELYPAPNYASTGGLEVQIQRPASYFSYTDTTKTPGFASQFHRLISLWPALDFVDVNTMPQRAAKIEARITAMETELGDFYSTRNMDEKQFLELSREDYGEIAIEGGIGGSQNPGGFS